MNFIFRSSVMRRTLNSGIDKRLTIMDILYKQKAEPGRQCQECQSFKVRHSDPAEGTCFGKEVFAEGGCIFFKAKEGPKNQTNPTVLSEA